MIDPQFFDMVGKNTTKAAKREFIKGCIWCAAGIICCVIATIMFFGRR